MFTAFPDLKVEFTQVLVDGHRAVLHWRFSGTHLGPFAGVDGSGKHVSLEGMTSHRFEGSGMSYIRFFYDFSAALLKTGALKVKPV